MIREISTGDLEAVNEIYTQAVDAKFSTAHTEPLSMGEWAEWFRRHDPDRYPVFVWEENNQVTGWISFSPYREGRKALQSTAEISYYVHPDHHRRGIGSALLEHAIQIAPDYEFKTLIAILLEPNIASIALLEKSGFMLWGDMPGIAEIDGRKYNHQYYGLHIAEKGIP
jgi:phosphinothricin acetyltransferase